MRKFYLLGLFWFLLVPNVRAESNTASVNVEKSKAGTAEISSVNSSEGSGMLIVNRPYDIELVAEKGSHASLTMSVCGFSFNLLIKTDTVETKLDGTKVSTPGDWENVLTSKTLTKSGPLQDPGQTLPDYYPDAQQGDIVETEFKYKVKVVPAAGIRLPEEEEEASDVSSVPRYVAPAEPRVIFGDGQCCGGGMTSSYLPSEVDALTLNDVENVHMAAEYEVSLGGVIPPGQRYGIPNGRYVLSLNPNESVFPPTLNSALRLYGLEGSPGIPAPDSVREVFLNPKHVVVVKTHGSKITSAVYLTTAYSAAYYDPDPQVLASLVPLSRVEITRTVNGSTNERTLVFSQFEGASSVAKRVDKYTASSNEATWEFDGGKRIERGTKLVETETPTSANDYLRSRITQTMEISENQGGQMIPVSYSRTINEVNKDPSFPVHFIRLKEEVTGVPGALRKTTYQKEGSSFIVIKSYEQADTLNEYLVDSRAVSGTTSYRPWLSAPVDGKGVLKVRDRRDNINNEVQLENVAPTASSAFPGQNLTYLYKDRQSTLTTSAVLGADGHTVSIQREVHERKEVMGHADGSPSQPAWRKYILDYQLDREAYDGSPRAFPPTDPHGSIMIRGSLLRRVDVSGKVQEYGQERPFAVPGGTDPSYYPAAQGPFKISIVTSDLTITLPSMTGTSIKVPNKTTRVVSIRGKFGAASESTQVWTGVTWENLSVERYFYNTQGKMLSVTRDGDTVQSYSRPNETTETVTDAYGAVTTHVTDTEGNPVSVTQEGAAATGTWEAQPAITTTYSEAWETSGSSSTIIGKRNMVTRSAGGLTQQEFDVTSLGGRPLSRTDAGGIVTSYSSSGGSGFPTETVSRASGQVTYTSSRYLDGRPHSQEGTGQAKRVITYEVITTGQQGIRETETLMDGETPVGTNTRLMSGDGVLLSQTVEGVTTSFNYDQSGRLVKTITSGPNGNRVYLYEYDFRDLAVKEGLDVNGDGALTANSADVMVERERHYELDSGVWWLVHRESRYLVDGNETAKQTTTRREKQGTGSGSLVTITYPDEAVETSTTTVAGKVVTTVVTSTRFPGRSQTQIQYNGKLVSSQDFSQTTPVLYRYDALGRQTQVVDASQYAVSTQVYDSATGRISSSSNSANETTTYGYYPATHVNAGQVAWIKNPADEQTDYAYNKFGRVTQQSGAGSQFLTYNYNGAGQLNYLETTPAPYPTAPVRRMFNWQGQRLLGRTYGVGAGGVSYQYNTDGSLHERTWAGTGANRTTVYSYHPTGQLSGINYPDATPDVGMTYDRAGRLKTLSDDGGLHTYNYSTNGDVQETVAGGLLDGLVLTKRVNSAGEVLAIEWSFAGVSQKASYTYDSQSRLENASLGPVNGSPLVTANYGYHPGTRRVQTLTRPIASGDPLIGTQTVDVAGRLDTSIWQRGSTVYGSYDYGLDAAGRRTTELREDGTRLEYDYNDRGELTSAVRRRMSDASLRPDWTHGYAYDNSGNRTNTLTPEGETLSYNIQLALGSSEVVFGKGMASKSWLRGRANPQAEVKVDGLATTREGETWRHLLALPAPWASQFTTISATRNDLTPVPAPLTQTVRLRANTRTAEPLPGLHDERGNLKADANWIYTWDAENRLVAQEMRFQGVPGESNEYVKKLEFRYDGKGRRIWKRESHHLMSANGFLLGANWTPRKETIYIWQDWTLVAEFSTPLWQTSSLKLKRSYLWGLDVNGTLGGAGGVGGLLWVADYVPNHSESNRQLAPWYDGNGNVMGWVENEGAQKLPLHRLEYDPFGKLLVDDAVRVARTKKQRDLNVSAWDLDRPPFTFSTKYEDVESGLLYYGYRYYAPEMGRWLSRDPIGEQGGINLYGMCYNDPVNFIDTDGRAPMNGGVGGPQVVPPGGYPRTPDKPENRSWDSSNLEQLLAKVDSEGQVGKKCDECLLAKVRELKKDILRFAIKWNKNSKEWCKGNECSEQAEKLANEIRDNLLKPRKLENGFVDPKSLLWDTAVAGGNKIPPYFTWLDRRTNHNVVQVNPLVTAGLFCGFKSFYIDAFKGNWWQHQNSNNGIDTGPWSEFQFNYPWPVK
ncbi:MAG: RHS repeat-associated core domain-containing protein [Verrucomicrobiota bacterium]